DLPGRGPIYVWARVECGAVFGFAHDQGRSGAGETFGDGGRGEGAQQGSQDGTQAPYGQCGDRQVDAFGHEGGHSVFGADTEVGQAGGQGAGTFGEFTVGQGGGGECGADFGDGHGVGVMPVTEQVGHRCGGGVIGGEPVAYAELRVGHRWWSSFSLLRGLWLCTSTLRPLVCPASPDCVFGVYSLALGSFLFLPIACGWCLWRCWRQNFLVRALVGRS